MPHAFFHANLRLLFIGLFLIFQGCSQPPSTPPKAPTESVEPLPAPEPVDVSQLQVLAQQALENQAWLSYLTLQRRIWRRQIAPAEKKQTAMATLTQLQNLRPAQTQALRRNHAASTHMMAWLDLVAATQAPKSLRSLLISDLATFYPKQWFHPQLIPALQQRWQAPQTFAVFLPMSGPYQEVGEQIQNGMLKYQFQKAQKTQKASKIELLFFDSAKTQQLSAHLTQAKQAQVDALIGPLAPKTITQLLTHIHNQPEWSIPVMPLNALKKSTRAQFERASFALRSFDFVNPHLAQQLAQGLTQQAHRRIGILTSVDARYAETATAIASAFKTTDATPKKRQTTQPTPTELGVQPDPKAPLAALIRTFPADKADLRKSLGKLIHEDKSEARKHNLWWLLREPIEFTPRPRQDLDAIVLLTDRTHMAVFQPQFDFFDLTLPVYSTEFAMPATFSPQARSPDLANIRFLTMPASLSPTSLQTRFEAYGWDALLLGQQFDNIQPQQCLHTTKTGQIALEDHQYQRRSEWARYDQNGVLVHWRPQR